MLKNFCISKSYCQWILRISTIVLSCIYLIGCSGGISGTGDGGPIVAIDPTVDGTANTGEDASLPDGSTDDNTDASADGDITIVPVYNHQVFPPQLINPFSSALIRAGNLNEMIPALSQTPVTQLIGNQLNVVTQQSIQAQVDLAILEENLLDTLLQCDAAVPCSTLPSVVTATVSPELLGFQQSLQPQTQQAAGDQLTYSGVSYTRELPGYFDQKLRFTNTDGTDIQLLWTTDNQLVSLTIFSSTGVTYLLTDFQQSTTTLRTEDNTTATVLHAVINGADIEADLRGEQQLYIRATADDNSITLYAIHPTDPNVLRAREAFDLSSGNFAIESCAAINGFCETWQPVASNDSDIRERLTATEQTLGDFALSISSNLQVSIPEEVDEFVIATDDTEAPDTSLLVCGGQRVSGTVRSFCWQPLPLAGALQLFEEIPGNGSGSTFQLLPNAQIQ